MSNLFQSLIPFAAYPYRGQSIPCNLCGSHEKTVICKKDRRWKPLQTVACSDCGLMRTDPMPTDAELEQYYRDEYRFDYQFAGERPPKAHLVRSLRDAHSRVAMLGDALKPSARVLDVGCGTGEFLKLAKEKGCEVIGIEPGKAYAHFARSEYELDVINGLWQDADLPEKGFDVVTCNQVVEHLRDPMAALGAIANWLKPDGVAFIAVPDMRPNHKPSFERFHFAHIYGFTPETLEVAMRCNGLVPASGEPLTSTTAVFKKSPSLDRASITVRDPSRSQKLAATYPDDTVVSYVFGGGYFRHAAHRFGKWRRDTFLKDNRGPI
jgi:2-polyprenyl-3-methyl-5-hydroxy-6-metoxy-1,4-benzoquinol methylase